MPKTGFQWYKLGAVGGWGGTAFEDPLVSASVRVTKIRVTAGCYVYRVKFEYSSGAKQTDHGGSGPSLCPLSWVGPIAEEQSFDLDQDEFIRGINGRSGRYIDQLEFVTNKRTIGPFGGDGGEPFYMIAPPDFKVKRLFGRSGAFIDGLGIIVEK
ncbi:jacalin-like lectin [Nitrosomonas communis]|uniref:Jacalin-like lectin domain-containing protein n=1 Tax=Nitrosomonas communis TaxID=44574 RepID=A0A1I4XMQ6_9PROT|nr:jacalin-like lectin [Nitrosomonas communis]SFN27158.1 Jacalin-like lectin domain-containing protein [Nitrosomonas communis]